MRAYIMLELKRFHNFGFNRFKHKIYMDDSLKHFVFLPWMVWRWNKECIPCFCKTERQYLNRSTCSCRHHNVIRKESHVSTHEFLHERSYNLKPGASFQFYISISLTNTDNKSPTLISERWSAGLVWNCIQKVICPWNNIQNLLWLKKVLEFFECRFLNVVFLIFSLINYSCTWMHHKTVKFSNTLKDMPYVNKKWPEMQWIICRISGIIKDE